VRCAPSNARELRELRPTTVGFIGAAYRPTPDTGVGAALGIGFESSTYTVNKEDDERDPTQRENYQLGVFYHRYLMADSAFFLGIGADTNQTTYTFDERTNTYSSANKTYADVEYDVRTTRIGMPLGWAWIWEEGFTIILDIGPRLEIAKSGSYDDDGEDEDVDVDRRDDYVDRLTGRVISFGASGIIGYSF
jgi:hypothetical protein